MDFLRGILLIPLILVNVGIGVTNQLDSGFYLHAKPPVTTENNNGMRLTEGGQVGPWVLRIMDGNEFACGAAYFSALYALTSANCMHSHRSKLKALSVEFLDSKQNYREDSFALIHTVFVPKEWRFPETLMDVAVVKLSNRLRGNFHKFVKLWSKPLSTNNSISVVACESAENVRIEGLTMLNRMDCESQYGSLILDQTLVCAKQFKRTSACMFSPGCPVTSGDQLCGIVAWGPACKKPGMPGIFTDIHQVSRFIHRAISGKGRSTAHRKSKLDSDIVPEWHAGFLLSR
ncbi:seminase [Drosophila rhopaloa]|uniref:trypsin n=1 Tax=Drosophila rhopaloa TaxID=1041015 RepID=A0A6P4FI14_DRORH|nr:seminase [Drosophila rhopaloa]